MHQEQLKKLNIDNLTNLWKIMGFYTSQLNNEQVIYSSVDWPHRVWLDWNCYPTSKDIEMLFATIRQTSPIVVVPTWYETDRRLTNALYENQFKVLFKQIAMVLPLHKKFQPGPSNLTFMDVTTQEMATIWTDIASLSFGYYIPASLIQEIIGLPKLKLILAFLDDIPVATGLLFENSEVVGIHLVGVAPSHRRQGIARQLMYYLIQVAQELDIAYATLQASVMGEPLYETLGFEKQFTITNFCNVENVP